MTVVGDEVGGKIHCSAQYSDSNTVRGTGCWPILSTGDGSGGSRAG